MKTLAFFFSGSLVPIFYEFLVRQPFFSARNRMFIPLLAEKSSLACAYRFHSVRQQVFPAEYLFCPDKQLF